MSIVERVRYVKHSDAAIKYAVKLENEKKEFLSLMSLSKIVTKKLTLNFYRKAYITNAQTKPHLTFSCRWSLSYKTSPLTCRGNQWTGFYMIGTSVMNKLKVSPNIPIAVLPRFLSQGF